ncbi:MAG: DUF1127 domain-containing protein [Paracoccaceae bacterium]
MAYVNSTRTVSNGLADRFTGFVKSLKLAAQRRAVYEQTVRELNALTNRELADLGIARLNIADVARVAAYGK